MLLSLPVHIRKTSHLGSTFSIMPGSGGRIAGSHGYEDEDKIEAKLRPIMLCPTSFPNSMDRSAKGVNKALLLSDSFQQLFKDTVELSPTWNFKPTALSNAIYKASKAGTNIPLQFL